MLWKSASHPVHPEPFRGSNNPFTGVSKDHPADQIFTLQLLTVAQLQLGSSNKNYFMVGGAAQHEIALKVRSIRKVENSLTEANTPMCFLLYVLHEMF